MNGTSAWISRPDQGTHRRAVVTPTRTLALGECLTHRGGTVRCVEGRLWVTVEGDGRDYIVNTGQSMRLPSRGMSVVQAMSASRVEIER